MLSSQYYHHYKKKETMYIVCVCVYISLITWQRGGQESLPGHQRSTSRPPKAALWSKVKCPAEIHGSRRIIRNVPWFAMFYHVLPCFASINEDLTDSIWFEYKDGDKNGSSKFVTSTSSPATTTDIGAVGLSSILDLAGFLYQWPSGDPT